MIYKPLRRSSRTRRTIYRLQALDYLEGEVLLVAGRPLEEGVLRGPHIVNVACLKAYVDASEEK